MARIRHTAEVPMSEAGTAERLFVRVDIDPGTSMNIGMPDSFVFFLCDGNAFPGSCGLTCIITGPDTTCNDLTGIQVFAQGDYMSLWAIRPTRSEQANVSGP